MLKKLLFTGLVCCFWGWLSGQTPLLTLTVTPVWGAEKVALDQPLRNSTGDSLAFHTVRFYLGNCTFFQRGTPVFDEPGRYRLVDLENENSQQQTFDFPATVVFDSLAFDLGVDSATTVAGVQGGDLDPTRGMFWTWQSGYINAKLEGFWASCPTRQHEFQCHLGGYRHPFQTCQRIGLAAPPGATELRLDLAPLLAEMAQRQQFEVMSPTAAAVALSQRLAQSFFWNGR